MINAIFEEKDGAKRMTGYASVNYSSSDADEIVVETSSEELEGILPSTEEGGWQENYRKFKLDSNDEIVFDENFEPKDWSGKN